MKSPTPYTCNEYREEMILLGLRRQLADARLGEEQRRVIAEKIRRLERQMGME